jgi:amino acid transporter
MTTWSLGANRAAVEAAQGGELPMVFAREHPVRQTPTFAFVASGVISSVVLIVTTVLLNEADAAYFAIFAASSVVFLLPYLLMFPSFLRLRKLDPDTRRPYRAPGGRSGAITWTVLTTVIIAITTVLFLWTPGEPIDWAYTGWLLTIVGVTLVAGEVLVTRAMRAAARGA